MCGMGTGPSRLLVAAATAVLVLSVAACGGGGGGGGSPTTTTAAGGTSAEQWANGVCSSFTTWKKSLQSIQTEVTSQPSKSQLRQAEREIESATQTLARSLKKLGKPETAQGEAAKQHLDQLANALQQGMSQLQDTLTSGSSGTAEVLAQISAIATTLTNMANKLKIAGGNLQQFAPSGELRQAFHEADACKAYVH
jgi:DNA repair exonuclease SbcCD ATPase subunit